MRILWFSNVPTPEMARHEGQNIEGGGHWIAQLANHVLQTNKIELGIATAFPGLSDSNFSEAGVENFVISQPRRCAVFEMRPVDLEKCTAVIQKFKPDIIHVHGSERFFGMVKAAGKTRLPMLISIQGLLGSFSKFRHFFGAMSPADILKSIRLIELPLKLGLIWQYLDARKGAMRESQILASADGFLGRTEWDRVHVHQSNPNAMYFHVGEILRPVFYETKWSLDKCDRYSLIYTNASIPCRGTENLIEATAFLSKEFPAIKLRLAGRVSTRSGYGRFIRQRIRELGLEDRVDFLGYINDETMARELSRTHVFAISSYIENSANSLCEAMLIGMPCVASYVGGTPDLVRNNETGLLYPVDDIALLAAKIRSIFLNDELAVRLGRNAREVALERHNPKTVIEQLLTAYQYYYKR